MSATSDFTSPTFHSAFWQNGANLCQSTGRAVLVDAKHGLYWEAPSEPDGIEQEAATTGWSVSFLTSLADLLKRYGHTSEAQRALSDAASGRISIPTMQAILWAANSKGVRTAGSTTTNIHLGAPSDYLIPADAVLPRVGTVPPMPLDGVDTGADCAPGRLQDRTIAPMGAIGVRSVNPLLLLGILFAVGVAGYLALETAREGQGDSW